jgi:hypothetical protein
LFGEIPAQGPDHTGCISLLPAANVVLKAGQPAVVSMLVTQVDDGCAVPQDASLSIEIERALVGIAQPFGSVTLPARYTLVR